MKISSGFRRDAEMVGTDKPQYRSWTQEGVGIWQHVAKNKFFPLSPKVRSLCEHLSTRNDKSLTMDMNLLDWRFF